MLSRDVSLYCFQPVCFRCDICQHRVETEAAVDVETILTSETHAVAMNLRRIGESIGPDTQRLERVLSYMLDIMATAHDASRHSINVNNSSFQRNVVSVDGALQLLIHACGWCYDEEQNIVFYDRNPSEPSQRQLVAIEMVNEELEMLPLGRRPYTAPFAQEMPKMREEFHLLAMTFESRDYTRSVQTLQRWVRLYGFFRLRIATAEKSDPDMNSYMRMLHQIRQYTLHTIDLVRATSANMPLPPLPAMQQATPSTTPVKEGFPMDTPPSMSVSGASPVIYHSPAEALVRSPPMGLEREEYAMAQPAPHLLSRDPATEHAGLLNMRQCCFMNSLLQSYFRHPSMPHVVLSAPCADTVAPAQRDETVKLLHRLQALFAYMETSSISCINPRYILDSVGALHPSFRDGGQHDPQEFASCVVEMLVNGFERVQPERVPYFSKLFRGICVERSVGWDGVLSPEARTTPIMHCLPLYFEASKTVPTQHRDPNDLFSILSTPAARYSLDAALLDYIVEEKESACTVACVAKAFTALPSLLMVHFPSRVTSAAGGKHDVAMSFPDELDLTPYAATSPEAEAVRVEYVTALCKERSLARDIERAKKQSELLEKAAEADPTCPATQRLLELVRVSSEAHIKSLTSQHVAALEVRKALFPLRAVPSQVEFQYRLHAVIVHIGATSDLGHYISYVRDTTPSVDNTRPWLRCDDTTVRAVPTSDVFSLITQRNVYCLLYSNDYKTRPNLVVPEYLGEIIQHEDHRKYERIARRLSMYASEPAVKDGAASITHDEDEAVDGAAYDVLLKTF